MENKAKNGRTVKVGQGGEEWNEERLIERFDEFIFERYHDYEERLRVALVTLPKLEASTLAAARELGAEKAVIDHSRSTPLFDVQALSGKGEEEATLIAFLNRALTIAECRAKLKECEGFFWECRGIVAQDWSDPRVMATGRRLWRELVAEDDHMRCALRELKLDFESVLLCKE